MNQSATPNQKDTGKAPKASAHNGKERCSKCQKTNHPTELCNLSEVVCKRCHKKGHVTYRCPKALCAICNKWGHSYKICDSKPGDVVSKISDQMRTQSVRSKPDNSAAWHIPESKQQDDANDNTEGSLDDSKKEEDARPCASGTVKRLQMKPFALYPAYRIGREERIPALNNSQHWPDLPENPKPLKPLEEPPAEEMPRRSGRMVVLGKVNKMRRIGAANRELSQETDLIQSEKLSHNRDLNQDTELGDGELSKDRGEGRDTDRSQVTEHSQDTELGGDRDMSEDRGGSLNRSEGYGREESQDRDYNQKRLASDSNVRRDRNLNQDGGGGRSAAVSQDRPQNQGRSEIPDRVHGRAEALSPDRRVSPVQPEAGALNAGRYGSTYAPDLDHYGNVNQRNMSVRRSDCFGDEDEARRGRAPSSNRDRLDNRNPAGTSRKPLTDTDRDEDNWHRRSNRRVEWQEAVVNPRNAGQYENVNLRDRDQYDGMYPAHPYQSDSRYSCNVNRYESMNRPNHDQYGDRDRYNADWLENRYSLSRSRERHEAVSNARSLSQYARRRASTDRYRNTKPSSTDQCRINPPSPPKADRYGRTNPRSISNRGRDHYEVDEDESGRFGNHSLNRNPLITDQYRHMRQPNVDHDENRYPVDANQCGRMNWRSVSNQRGDHERNYDAKSGRNRGRSENRNPPKDSRKLEKEEGVGNWREPQENAANLNNSDEYHGSVRPRNKSDQRKEYNRQDHGNARRDRDPNVDNWRAPRSGNPARSQSSGTDRDRGLSYGSEEIHDRSSGQGRTQSRDRSISGDRSNCDRSNSDDSDSDDSDSDDSGESEARALSSDRFSFSYYGNPPSPPNAEQYENVNPPNSPPERISQSDLGRFAGVFGDLPPPPPPIGNISQYYSLYWMWYWYVAFRNAFEGSKPPPDWK